MFFKKCKRGHKWSGFGYVSEFVTTQDICSRCGKIKHIKPYGVCLGGHMLADHYDDEGNLIPIENCVGPR